MLQTILTFACAQALNHPEAQVAGGSAAVESRLALLMETFRRLVIEYVSRSLLKDDRALFGLSYLFSFLYLCANCSSVFIRCPFSLWSIAGHVHSRGMEGIYQLPFDAAVNA